MKKYNGTSIFESSRIQEMIKSFSKEDVDLVKEEMLKNYFRALSLIEQIREKMKSSGKKDFINSIKGSFSLLVEKNETATTVL